MFMWFWTTFSLGAPGKSKNEKPRPILARFLRYKDVQKIFSLGHRLRETDFQMFRDHPAEIFRRRKEQMKTFKETRRNNIPAPFSLSEPDKLFIRGQGCNTKRGVAVFSDGGNAHKVCVTPKTLLWMRATFSEVKGKMSSFLMFSLRCFGRGLTPKVRATHPGVQHGGGRCSFFLTA